MKTVSSQMTVAEYCASLDRHEILVNHDYQRSDKVWPPSARSFLIETILLDYPVPKLSLFQKTDVRSRKTIKEIVDGQQRSAAILDFFHDKLILGRCEGLPEASGCRLKQLDEDLQKRFLEYGLQVDVFVAATPEEIREMFRRINSYTVPLNSEEQRHAVYQGEFKWFIYRIAREYDKLLIAAGAFSEKQIVRMADAKLYTEVVHALAFGIKTTKAPDLESLYDKYDQSFEQEENWEFRLRGALNYMLSLQEIHATTLMKPFLLYTLLLAIIHRGATVDNLRADGCPGGEPFGPRDVVLTNLTALAEAINQEEHGRFEEFALACSKKTNVADQRQKRFKWLYRALGDQLI